MKNSPSFLSTSDVLPFFDDEDEAAPDDVEAIILLNPGITSDSSHMYESTWQIPSSTSGWRFRYPAKFLQENIGKMLCKKRLSQFGTFKA